MNRVRFAFLDRKAQQNQDVDIVYKETEILKREREEYNEKRKNEPEIVIQGISFDKQTGEDAYKDVLVTQNLMTLRENLLKQLIGMSVGLDDFSVSTLPQKTSDEQRDELSFINWWQIEHSNFFKDAADYISNEIPPPQAPSGALSRPRIVYKTSIQKGNDENPNFERHKGSKSNAVGYITDYSLHWCACYVRQILEYSGISPKRVINGKDILGRWADDYLKVLPALGFDNIKQVTSKQEANQWTATEGMVGDVCVTPKNDKHDMGHICILTVKDGKKVWVSDFWQKSMLVYQDWLIGFIFRYTGEIVEEDEKTDTQV